MVQPYPAGKSSGNQMVGPDRPAAPPSVLNAVKLMYVGAAVSTVSLVISLIEIPSIKSSIRKAEPSWTAAQVNTTSRFFILVAVISGVLGIGLWLWMARANGQGRNWARILSSSLFVLWTLEMFIVLSEPKTLLGLIFPVLTWLVGLGAVVLLWRRESSEFFKPVKVR